MLWKLSGQLTLEDVQPVPKKPPGRHFSTSYHILGNVTKSYDAKYAQMKYGEHYRQKVLAQIEQERQRCESILAEEKKKAAKMQALSFPAGNVPSPPRYDLNELRHHQRRCAALLFGTRKRGPHELPMLVRWAPKRRESYYLMSERVYNDRLMLMLKNKEEAERKEESPLCFDFLDNEGDTDDLHDLQKLILKTSKDISGLQFDTKYKDYDYEFKDQTRSRPQEESLGLVNDDVTDDEKLSSNPERSTNTRVTFSDDVETITTGTRRRNRRHRNGRPNGGETEDDLDPSGIEISFESGSESSLVSSEERDNVMGQKNGNEEDAQQQSEAKSRNSRNARGSKIKSRHYSSRDGDVEGKSDGASPSLSCRDSNDLLYSLGRPSDINSDGDPLAFGNLHGNKHCRHSPSSLKKKSQEYYKSLPKLLKTSEMREKLPKAKHPKARELGNTTDHSCMREHKIAYNRALALARFRSLPFSYSFLAGKTTAPYAFSYFPGARNSAIEVHAKDEKKKPSKHLIPPGGRDAIFGDIDMDDFYSEKDELLYYIKPEELKTVVESITTGSPEMASDNESEESEETQAADTTTVTTSRSNTTQMYSTAADTDTEIS